MPRPVSETRKRFHALIASGRIYRSRNGGWFTRSLDTARWMHSVFGGVLLVSGGGYEVCDGCAGEQCKCRPDPDYVAALAPSWDETAPGNAELVRQPVQDELF